MSQETIHENYAFNLNEMVYVDLADEYYKEFPYLHGRSLFKVVDRFTDRDSQVFVVEDNNGERFEAYPAMMWK